MKHLALAIMVLALSARIGWAGPAGDFFKALHGVPVQKEVQEHGKTVKYQILKLEKALDLNKVGEASKQPQASPLLLMQTIAGLLVNLDDNKVAQIKSYYTAGDALQRTPAARFMAIMKRDRKDWTISSVVQSGDYLILCGHFKDGATGEVVSDMWPMTYENGKWYMVVMTTPFVAAGGMAIMVDLGTKSTDF